MFMIVLDTWSLYVYGCNETMFMVMVVMEECSLLCIVMEQCSFMVQCHQLSLTVYGLFL